MELTEITAPAVDGRPHPDLLAGLALWERWSRATLGHNDLQNSAREVIAGAASTNVGHHWWVVRDGDRVVGWLEMQVPLTDNLHRVDLELATEPGRDPEPILDVLWAAARARIGELGRRSVGLWSTTPLDRAEGAEVVVPESGSGAIVLDAASRWIRDTGFVLEQVEKASVLEVPDGLGDVDALAREAESAGEAYAVVTWSGVVPEEHVERLAHLRARMSVDAPSAGMELEMERWDADRVRADDRLVASMGRTPVWALAVDRASGEAVAYTLIVCPPENPEVAYQEDTLVLTGHRGHRLGMRLKVANLRQLRALRAGVRRVYTWNADENAWMLAINTALGFRLAAYEGCWQQQL